MESFDNLDKAQEEVYWLDLDNGSDDPTFTIQEDGEVIEKLDEPTIVGELLEIRENVGTHDSRTYKLDVEGYDRPIMFWGNGGLDTPVDNANIGPGDTFGVRNTGEFGETDNGRFTRYDVRYAKQ